MIKISNIRGKGRCVLADQDFKKNQIIERAPVIIVPNKDWKYIKKTELDNWNYYWKSNGDFAIVLGYGSIYNHSYTPNAFYRANIKNKTMDYIALKSIKRNEEILVNYNGEPDNQSPMWFNVR